MFYKSLWLHVSSWSDSAVLVGFGTAALIVGIILRGRFRASSLQEDQA